MPTLKFVSYPKPVGRAVYDTAIERMVRHIAGKAGVKSIFQIGSVGEPGISDIDLMVIFESGAVCIDNVLNTCPDIDRYLFVHKPFGISATHLPMLQDYTFFHNYKFLWGEALEIKPSTLGAADQAVLKQQIALQYLLRMLIAMTVERRYGVIRVRGLLLHAKAIGYDLEFLGIRDGALKEMVDQVIDWRRLWFERAPEAHELQDWHDRFYAALREFLAGMLEATPLFIPRGSGFNLARNITVRTAPALDVECSGIVLPKSLSCIGNKYFNIQHRLNRFILNVPIQNTAENNVLENLHKSALSISQQNQLKFPHFMVPGSSLNVWLAD